MKLAFLLCLLIEQKCSNLLPHLSQRGYIIFPFQSGSEQNTLVTRRQDRLTDKKHLKLANRKPPPPLPHPAVNDDKAYDNEKSQKTEKNP